MENFNFLCTNRPVWKVVKRRLPDGCFRVNFGLENCLTCFMVRISITTVWLVPQNY